MRKLVLLIMLLAAIFSLQAQISYVDADASGSNNGTTWQNAYSNLSEAIAAAQSGDQIWVAAGIYYPTHQPNYPVGSADSRFNHFTLKNGVSIIGGFAGDETSVGQRNLSANKSVISGDIDCNDNVEAEGYVLDNNKVVGSNSLKLFYFPEGSTIDTTAVLDGFVLTGAVADNDVFPYMGGAAFLCQGGASPKVVNCDFYGNYAKVSGGAIWLNQSSMIIENCTFSGNYAEVNAGAVCFNNTSARLKACTFVNNTSKFGGAVYVGGGNKTSIIEDCIFDSNTTITGGNGGAISISSAKVLLTNSRFTNNYADSWGGAIVFHGACDVDMVNCVVNGNTAKNYGGGIGCHSGTDNLRVTIRITNTKIQGNQTQINYGGGIALAKNTDCKIYNSLISGNKIPTKVSNDGGGAVTVEASSNFEAYNCTFVANNNRDAVTGYKMADLRIVGTSKATIYNSIIWDYDSEYFVDGTSSINIYNSRTVKQSSVNGNTDANPGFITNPATIVVPSTEGDYSLWGNSIVNNKCNNSYLPKDIYDLDDDGNTTEVLPCDLSGEARVFAGIADMGCFEQQFATKSGNSLLVNTTQQLKLGSGVTLNNTDFTIEMWIKPSLQSNYSHHGICGNTYVSGATNYRAPSLYLFQYDRIHYGYTDASANWLAGDTEKAIKVGQWNHIAMTFDKDSKTLKLYANGRLLEEMVTSALPSATPLEYINPDKNLDATSIDEFRVWKEERTLAQLTDNMGKTLTGNEANLVQYYSFDQVNFGDIEDQAGSNNGILLGDPGLFESNAILTPVLVGASNVGVDNFTITWLPVLDVKEYLIDVATDEAFINTIISNQSVGTALSTTINGLSKGTVYYYKVTAVTNNGDSGSQYAYVATKMTPPGNAFAFDGATYVEANDVCKYDLTGGASIECWINTTNLYQAVWACNNAAGYNNYILFSQTDGHLLVAQQNGATPQDLHFGNAALLQPGWNHVAVTIGNDVNHTVSIYVNGVFKGTGNGIAEPFPYGSKLSLGQEWDGATASDFYTGQMDEFRVWDKVLTLAEIQANMNKTLSGTETGLVTYYDFDQQTGTKVVDKANVFDGNIIGNVSWVPSTINNADFKALSLSQTSSGFTLNWDAVAGATGYNVDVATDNSFANKVINAAASSGTSYVASGLDEGTKYYYQVTASNGSKSLVDYISTAMVIPGKALYLDGINDYIEANQIAEQGNKIQATMECWAYVDPTESLGRFLAINTATGGNKYLLSFEPTVGYCLYLENGATTKTIASYDLRKGAWVHLAVVMNGITSTSFYLNGKLVGTATGGSDPLFSGNQISFGQEFDGTRTSDFLKGALDEVRFWSTIRTQSQIQTNMHKTLVGIETGLLAYYSFDQNEGQFVYEKKKGLDASIVGNPQWEQSNAIITPLITAVNSITPSSAIINWYAVDGASDYKIEVATDVSFKNIFKTIASTGNVGTYTITELNEGTDYFIRVASLTNRWSAWSLIEKISTLLIPPGNALYFNGADDQVNLGSIMSSNWSAMTVEAWVKADQKQGIDWARLIGNYDNTNHAGFGLALAGWDGKANFEMRDASQVQYYVTGTTSINDNQWHHVAAVFNGSKLLMYVDGQLQNETDLGGTKQIHKSTIDCGIGNANDGFRWRYLTGSLDEIRIWNIARTEAEINEYAHKSLMGNESGLLAYYNLDKADGTTFANAVSANFSGTMIGSVEWAESKALITPFTLSATNIGNNGFTANWDAIPNATKYYVRVATDPLLTQPVEGLEKVDVGNVTAYNISGLTENTVYYFGAMSVTDRESAWSPASAKVTTTGSATGELAVNLNGASGYIDLSDHISKIAGKNAGAITGWFKTSTGGMLYSLLSDATNYSYIKVGNVNGTYTDESFSFWIRKDNTMNLWMLVRKGEKHYIDNQWHHFAVITGDGNNRILIDGIEQEVFFNSGNAQTQVFSTITNANKLYFGESLTGSIDELAIYKNPITIEEAIDRMHRKLVGTEIGLVGYYSFNDKTLTDNSGFGRNGAVVGTVTYQKANVLTVPVLNEPVSGVAATTLSWQPIADATEYMLEVATDANFQNKVVDNLIVTATNNTVNQLDKNTKYYFRVKAKVASEWSEFSGVMSFFSLPGKALVLDGVDDYVTCDGISNFASDEATIECWTNIEEKVGSEAIWAHNRAVDNINQYVLIYSSSNKELWIFTMNGGSLSSTKIATIDLLNAWHHIAVSIIKGGQSKVYVDGKFIGQFTSELPPIVSGYQFSIGQEWDNFPVVKPTDFFKGQIDEFRVWNIALTQEQIRANMNLSEPEGANEHYIAHYTFDELHDATTIKDLAKNNDATIVGGATIQNSEGVIIPITLEADNATLGSFDMHINNIASAASFEIEVAYDQTFVPPLAVHKNIGRNLNYTIDGLCPGVKYYFRTRAIYNENTISNWSAPDTLSTINQDAEIQNFTATQGDYSQLLKLSWECIYDYLITDFEIKRRIVGESEFSYLTTVENNTDLYHYTDSSAKPGTYYEYTIQGLSYCYNNDTKIDTSNVGYNIPSLELSKEINDDTQEAYIRLDYEFHSNFLKNVEILRTNTENGTTQTFSEIKDSLIYRDGAVELCTPYTYQLVAKTYAYGDVKSHFKAFTLEEDIIDAIDTLDASKGYFDNKIVVNWTSYKQDIIDRYQISRRKYTSDYSWSVVSVIENGSTQVWIDEDANAGEYYEYLIVGYGSCGEAILTTDSVYSVGFRQPEGILSGLVTYKGGNPVADVRVTVNYDETSKNYGSCVEFDGADSLVLESRNNTFDFTNGMTIEMWARPLSLDAGFILFKNSGLVADYTNDGNLSVLSGSAIVYYNLKDDSKNVWDDASWNHIAIRANSDSVNILINGTPVATSIATPNLILDATNLVAKDYAGYIDELRIWNIARTDSLIKRYYNVMISREQNNLVATLRFDENLGVYAFDHTRTGGEANKVHGYLFGATWSKGVPAATKLGLAAQTNTAGNYMVNGIWFKGSGETFSVIPAFGVHEFDPGSKSMLISENSLVYGDQNFIDISAFAVNGNVKYLGTTFPVDEVEILLDGDNIYDIENNIIKTNSDGNFNVEVPIGDHVLTVRRDGHYFAEGFYPPRENGEIVLHNFQDDITGLQFTDSTTRIISGRVIGGAKEGDKQIGFGKSVNNIGQYDIIIKAQREDFGYADTVTTDFNSGEYEFKVIPEVFVVESVLGNPAYMFDLNLEGPIDMTNKTAVETITDTILVDNGNGFDTTVMDYNYHFKKNWVYRTPMSIDVTKDNGNPVICDSVINPNGTDVSIYSVDGSGNVKYNYGQPVFAVAEPKTLRVIVTEQYTNNQTNETFIAPVTDAIVKIKNNLAIDDSQKEFALNGDGIASYTFIKGDPNLTEDALNPDNSFTKTLEVKAERTGESVDWLPTNGDVYRAIVLGVQVTGTNFVTQGPDRVDFVLRDPPGSNSNAFVEEGFTMERTETKSKNRGFDASLGVSLMVGKFVGGPTFNHESTWTGANTSTESITFNTSYRTSDDPAYVGAMGDVFFGRSTNILYGLCKQLSIFPTDSCHPDLPSGESVYNGYKIGQMYNFALGDEIATTFVFTQNHIENYLIPDLMKLRNNYFVTNPGIYELINEAEKDEIVPKTGYYKYNGGYQIDSVDLYQASINAWVMELVINEYEKLAADGDVRKVYDWGFTNIDWGIGDATVVQFGSYQKLYFTIGSGKSRTSAKIKRQFNRDENFFNKNISFDAGAIYESSMTSSTETSVERTYEFQTSIGFKSEMQTPGIKIPFIGRTPGFKIEASASVNFGGSNSNSETETKDRTVGYTLADGDQGDYFSVDVAKDAYGNGPIFITRGGQSACPYEGATETHFFNEGTLIGSPTMQIEVPTIQADQSMISNVPEDVPAVFTLKLGNQSEIDADNWFMLMVDVASNPYGAKLKMDGASINNGTAILIPGGKQLTKTLELEKGRADVNEYDDIRIIMHSMCQFDPTDDLDDIADTVILSAHFVPVCTDVVITHPSDNWLVNVANDDTLDVRISGYDLQLSTFEKFVLQYKAESDANWLTDATFFKDSTGYADHSGNKYMIDGASFMLHSIDMQNLRDRNYQIRAVSVCNDGSTYESAPKNGVLDGTRPTVFGTPSPADGILSPNDEIMVTFNEPVEAGLISQYNFDVQGVLNGSELNHGTSVAFDGNADYAKIPAGIRLSETDFAIEFWMQKSKDATGTIISQGSEAGGFFKVSFVADSMKIAIGDKVNTVENTFDDGSWHHYAISYNYTDLLVTVFVDDKLLLEQSAGGNESEGAILMGMADATNADYFEGNIHDMRIWKRRLAYNEVIEFMNTSLSGNEIGLSAYWPMDEGEGSLLLDKAHSRHANANAGWNITPSSNAYAFNGTNQALVFGTGSIPITTEMDFTIEFWFKCVAQNATLFSNGNTAVESGYPEKVVNININDAGKIEVETNNEILTTENVYADDSWHHLAFVVNRRGYANLYIDAEKLDNITAAAVGSLQGVEAYVGARGYIDNSQVQLLDKYFNGSIDEVRVWSLARTKDQIELYSNYKLNGSEIGLMAYYPFESYTEVMGIMQSEVSLNDFSIDPYSENGLSHCGEAVAVGDSSFTSISPNIKRERAKSNVNFDYVVNNDQIIITPTDDLAKIEKCILEITVQNIKDVHGNTMASPVTWTAYIKKNQVVWGENDFSLEKELSESLSFTTTVVNEGGTQQNFSISNLPNWLSVSPEMGSLDPDSELEVEFTVNDGLNIGNYSEDVFLVSNSGYNERLTLNLRVFKQAPNWVVDETAYQSSMNVIAQLAIKDVISNDKYDKIGVFAGDVCRGVCKLEYKSNYDAYFAFLVIYGNESGEELSYRVWDASEGKIYSDVSPIYNFEPNQFYGNMAAPVMFTAGNKLDNTINLNKGWTWLSFNLGMEDASVNTLFEGLDLSNGDVIKHAALFASYDEPMQAWFGSLSQVELGKLYRTYIQNGGSMLYMGTELKVADYAINLSNGWNRIGYIPTINMSVNEALAGFEPQVNDVVKSQFQFAMYDGFEWIGSLNFMEPGKGYMYQSNSADTVKFVYPATSSLSKKSATITGISFSQATQFEFAMSVVAKVDLDNIPAGYQLAAFINGQLRGLQAIEDKASLTNYSFITVYGNAIEKGEVISFVLVNSDAQITLMGSSAFAGNGIDGSLNEPVLLSITGITNVADLLTSKLGAAPNPFSNQLTVYFNLNESEKTVLEVYNLIGEKVAILNSGLLESGYHQITWEGIDMNSQYVSQGVYLIKLQTGKQSHVIKVVKN